ncbi:MAG: hypothetical protein JO368_09350, partial [Acidimicrobiales bacterium]|nr:hypothetical protein [Acidimicrobiales bacterium]
MTAPDVDPPTGNRFTRRGLLAGSGLAAAAAVVAGLGDGSPAGADAADGTAGVPSPADAAVAVPFTGVHQA